jgi:hypothetical protein
LGTFGLAMMIDGIIRRPQLRIGVAKDNRMAIAEMFGVLVVTVGNRTLLGTIKRDSPKAYAQLQGLAANGNVRNTDNQRNPSDRQQQNLVCRFVSVAVLGHQILTHKFGPQADDAFAAEFDPMTAAAYSRAAHLVESFSILLLILAWGAQLQSWVALNQRCFQKKATE